MDLQARSSSRVLVKVSFWFMMLVAVLSLLAALNLAQGRHVLPKAWITPARRMIAYEFVDAVVHRDWERAKRLTDNSDECVASLARTYDALVDKITPDRRGLWIAPDWNGNKPELETIWIWVGPTGATAEEIFLDNDADFMFVLDTTYTPLGSRYTCGTPADVPVPFLYSDPGLEESKYDHTVG